MASAEPEAFIPADADPVAAHQNFLDKVGRDNENVRNKCAEVVRKIEEAASLHRDVAMIFTHVDSVLADLEKTKSELIQRTSALLAERDFHGQLKQTHRETSEAFERFKADAAIVAGERKRHVHMIAELEVNLGALQLAHVEKVAQHADMQRQNFNDAEKMQEISRELANASTELQRADALIVALQGDAAAQRDRATLAEEDARALHVSLSETRQSAAKLGRSFEEAAMGLDTARKRIVDLESALATEKSEHSKFHALWQQESDGRRSDVSTMQIKIEAQISRIEASDRLLAAARNQFHVKVEELRKEERRSQEIAVSLDALEQKARVLDVQNSEMRAKLGESEKSRDSSLERAEQHLKTIMAKENAIHQGERKLQMLTDRFAADSQRFDSQRDQYERRIQKLTEMLEKEKLDRSLAQGALDSARKDRTRPAPQQNSPAEQSAAAEGLAVQGGARPGKTEPVEIVETRRQHRNGNGTSSGQELSH